MRLQRWLRSLARRSFTRSRTSPSGSLLRRRSSRAWPPFEFLEPRRVLAAVSWDGEGGDFQWSNPLNWSSNQLPGATDDVAIDVVGEITVTISGSHAIHSLDSRESVILLNGALTVSDASEISGNFSSSGSSTLTAAGSGASLVVQGTAQLVSTNLYATGGGSIDFLQAVSYSGLAPHRNTVRADGPGSQIRLANVPTMQGAVGGDQWGAYTVSVEALNGGHVDLSATTQVQDQVLFTADGDSGPGQPSRIDLPLVTTFPGYQGLTVRGAGQIDVASLETIVASDLRAYAGGQLLLPALATYSRPIVARNLIVASGAGSLVDLSSATSLDGGTGGDQWGAYNVRVEALAGGHVDLAGTLTVTGQVNFTATGSTAQGQPSRIELTGLLAATGVGQSLAATAGGEIYLNATGVSSFSATTISTDATGSLFGNLSIGTAASLAGSGSVVGNVVNSGAVIPGNALGRLTVFGDYVQTAGGSLNIQLGGLVAGSTYDQFTVSGSATLDGALIVSLSGGFAPIVGDTFTILEFADRTGSFASETGTALGGNLLLASLPGATRFDLRAVANIPPEIVSLTATPDPADYFADLTLTASGVSDPNGVVEQVSFYRDSDDNGILELGTDALLAVDTDGGDGWMTTLPARDFPLGTSTIFAIATDDDTLRSVPVSDTVTVSFDGVMWDGEGGDLLWSNPLNWSGNTVPGPADNVLISVPGTITVTINGGSHQVQRLVSAESLSVATGSLTVTGPSQVDGTLLLAPHTTLTASGVAAAFVANGPTTVDGANLYALGGATLSLPAASYTGTTAHSVIQANGAGSTVDLSQAAGITGANGTQCCVQNNRLFIQALNGGTVDLGGATSVTGQVAISASGAGSLVDLPSATTLDGLTAPIKVDALSVTVSAGGQVSAPNVTTLRGATLIANDGLTLAFPSATTYQGIDADSTIRANGPGSVVDLSQVTSLSGATGNQCCTQNNRLFIQALNGGSVDLSAALGLTGQAAISASGTGSLVDLAAATTLDGEGVSVKVDAITVTVNSGGQISLPSATTLRGVSLFANDGLTLSLPAAATYEGVEADSTLRAFGSGSQIDLPNLTSLSGATGFQCCTRPNFVTIQPQGGGRIRMPNLANATGQTQVLVTSGGTLDLHAASTSLASLTIAVDETSTVNAGQVVLSSGTILSGAGTINADLINSAVVAPGPNTAALTVNGDYTQTSSGRLDVQLGGLAATQYDRLQITGLATLAGTLNVALTNGFHPSVGNAFTVMSFASRSGDFDVRQGLDLGGGTTLDTVFGPTGLVLQTSGDAPPAISSLAAAPTPVLQGAPLTLSAENVTDLNNDVASVTFYRDTNANGNLDVGTDDVLGSDVDGGDGWTLVVPLVGVPAGPLTLFAQAIDGTSLLSNVAATTVQVESAIYWDGGGGDLLWNNPLNWSGNALPGPANHAVINSPSAITVTISGGAVQVQRLVSFESLTIAAGSLTVTQPSEVSGTLTTAPGTTLTASGSLADFTASGSTVLNGNNLAALNGGKLRLPFATAYSGLSANRTMTASGTGSLIDLSGITTFAGSTGAACGACAPYETTIQALAGGVIDLSAATSMTNGAGVVAGGAGSQVQLDQLTTKSGGRIVLNDHLAVIHAPVLTSISNGSVQALGGGTLQLSSVTSYSGGVQSNTVQASGTGSRIDLSGVVTFAGSTGASCGNCAPYETTVQASAGGVIDLSAATSMTNGAGVVAGGAGSQVQLDQLTTKSGGRIVLNDNLAVIHAPVLTSISNGSLQALGGGTLQLSSVTSYSGGVQSNTVQASGTGSRIDLSGVVTFAGSTGASCGNCTPYETTVQADNGGVIDLSAATSMTNGAGVVAGGAGSQVQLDQLTTKSGGRIVLNDNLAVIHAPVLASISNGSLRALGGGTLQLSSVTSYSGGVQSNTVQASGAGSRIDLSGVVTFAGSTGASCGNCAPYETTVQADNGGVIDLSAVTSMTNGAGVVAGGAGSQVQLDQLTTKSGGRIVLNDNLAVIHAPVLASISNGSLRALGGGTLQLSSVTSYSGGVQSNTVQASGAGSRIDLSGVVTFAGSTGASCGNCAPYETTVQADNGGVIDLSAVTSMTNGAGVVAGGAGSQVQLDQLATKSGGRIVLNDNLAVIHAPVLASISNGSLQAFGGGTLQLSSVTSYSGGFQSNTVQASGAGSRVDLSGVATFAGSQGASCGICAPYETTVNATSGGEVTFGSGTVTLSQRVLLLAPTGQISGTRLVVSAGTIVAAEGVVAADLVNHGALSVYGSPGQISVLGDFEQSAAATLSLNLAGAAPATGYDRLSVSGEARLDGTLHVARLGGFSPGMNDSFEIVTYSSRECDFHTKTGLSLGSGLYLAASFDVDSLALTAGTTPDSGQQCQTIPTFTNVSVGPDPAKAGDTLSITFEVDVPLVSDPFVTVDGQLATLQGQNGTIYTYTYLVAGTENEGVVITEIVATSLDGGVGTTTAATTLDFTPPTITQITISDNPADVGQLLSVSFSASEALSPSTEVTIGGQFATLSSVQGWNYTYSRILTGDEGLGQVAVVIGTVDIAGNTSQSTSQALVVSGGFDIDAAAIALSDDSPAVGDTVTASISVRNSGLYDAANVPVRLTLVEPGLGDRILGTFTLPSIGAGSSALLTADFDLRTDGVHVLRAAVDPDDLFAEFRENDNVATRSLLVDTNVAEVLSLSAGLSQSSGLPGSLTAVSGTAAYLGALNTAGAAAGAAVTVRIPGTGFLGTTETDDGGAFDLELAMPVVPGNYVASVTVTDATTEVLMVLPFTVTAPANGVDFFTSNSLLHSSDDTPIAGIPVSLSAQVYNVGGNDSGDTFNVQFFEGPHLLATLPVAGLLAGQSTIVSFQHTFTQAGSHTITAVVDADNLVVELHEGNNAGSRTFQVLPPLPDLVPIDILVSDATPVSTEAIVISAVVSNQGGSAANQVEVRFFDGAVPIGMAVISGLAGNGGQATVAISATLSTAGQRQITVVVDPTDTVGESVETNNQRSETIVVHDPVADLVASLVTLSVPTPLANESVDVHVSVSNPGELPAGGFDVEFFRDGGSYGTVRVHGVAAGASTLVTLPMSFSAVGTHQVSVLVDPLGEVQELSETNNASSTIVQVLATPLPDLRIAAGEIVLSNPNPAAAELVTVSVPVRNIGAAEATGVTARLFVDGAFVGVAATTPPDIGTQGQANWTFPFTAPAGDGFHLLEIVVDESNAIAESNENNNRAFIQFLVGDHPDLVPFGIDFSSEAPTEGEVVTVSATVENDGALAASNILVRFLDGAQTIGQVVISQLPIGASQTVGVPFDTAGRTGQRLIQVVVDPANAVTEVNEGNNLIHRILIVAPGDVTPPSTTAARSVPANAMGWNSTDVDLSLTATDTGSGVAYLRYSVNGGPLQTILSGSHTLSFTQEGTYVVAFQATDLSQNEEPMQSVEVRIDKSLPAAVHAGPFQVVEGSSVILDGTASTDDISGVAAIAWAIDGDDVFDDGAIVTYFGADGPDTRTVALRVIDLAGNETIVATQIEILNAPPTAVPGSPYSVVEGSTVLLDGSLSHDPGNDITAYEWDWDYDGLTFDVDGAGSMPVFDASALFSPLTRVVALRVTDSAGASGLATTTVEILPTNVGPVVVEPADRGQTISGGPGAHDHVQIVVSLAEAIHAAVEADFDAYQAHLDNHLGSVPFTLASLGLSLVGFESFDRLLVYGSFRGVYVNPVVGTGSSETLTGTSEPDLVVGLGGNDTLLGLGGSDILVGGAGNDTFDGAEGDDVVLYIAQANGFDAYVAGAGFDRAIAVALATVIGVNGYAGGIDQFEGPGDTIVRDSDSSRVLDFTGTALVGIAQVDAAGGNDTVIASDLSVGQYRGGPGNDTLVASAASVTWLYAGTGNGYDTLLNGAATATARAESSGTVIGIDGYANGVGSFDGQGYSGVVIRDTNSSRTLDFSQTTLVGIQEVDAAGGNDTVKASAISGGYYRGGSGNDALVASAANVVWLYSGTSNGFDIFTNGTGSTIARAESDGTVIGVDGYVNGVDTVDGAGRADVVVRDTNSSRTLDFSQTELLHVREIDAAGGNDTVTASSHSSASYRGGSGNDALIASSANVVWLYDGTSNGFDVFTNATGISVARAESPGTVIGVDGFTNEVDTFDGNGHAGVTIRDTNSSRTLNFSQTTLLGIQEIDAAGGNDTVTASDLSDGSYRGGSGNDVLIAGNAAVYWNYSGTDNGFDQLVNGTGSSVARAESDGTVIGVDGFANGVETLDGSGLSGVIVRDTNSSRTLNFSQTTLLGIQEIDAAGGNDTVTASDLSDGSYRGGSGNDVLIAGNAAVYWNYSGTDNGFDQLVNGTGSSVARAESDGTVIGVDGFANGVETLDGSGLSGVIVRDTSSSRTLNFSQTTLLGIQEIDAAGGNDTVTASDLSNGSYRGGSGNDVLIAGNAAVYWNYSGTDNGFDQLVNGAGSSVARAESHGTVIGVDGYSNGVDIVDATGLAGVIVRDTNSSRVLDFTHTLLIGLAEIDAGGGNDTIVASILASSAVRGNTGNETFVIRPSASPLDIAILDFLQSGTDRVDLREFGFDAQLGLAGLTAWEEDGDTLIELSGDVTLRLVDVALASLDDDDFLF